MLYMFLGVCAFSVILSIMATIAQHASSTARRASVLGAPRLASGALCSLNVSEWDQGWNSRVICVLRP